MRRLLFAFLAVMVSTLILTGCSSDKKTEEPFEPAVSESSDAIFYVVRMMASLLKERPTDLSDMPGEIMTIQQGDQVTVLERTQEWNKVRHQKSGEIGWLHSTFLQLERRSPWWSGDTAKARTVAKKIYQDKSMLEEGYPIVHVSIEERFNKLVFQTKDDVDFPRDLAKKCAIFGVSRLIYEFPGWSDHQVFFSARDGDESYTLIMSDNKEPLFL